MAPQVAGHRLGQGPPGTAFQRSPPLDKKRTKPFLYRAHKAKRTFKSGPNTGEATWSLFTHKYYVIDVRCQDITFWVNGLKAAKGAVMRGGLGAAHSRNVKGQAGCISGQLGADKKKEGKPKKQRMGLCAGDSIQFGSQVWMELKYTSFGVWRPSWLIVS